MISPADRALLAFEDAHPKMTGWKPDQARAELGMSMTRYFQRLYVLVDLPEVEREFPQLAHRVQRVRDLNARKRAARRF